MPRISFIGPAISPFTQERRRPRYCSTVKVEQPYSDKSADVTPPSRQQLGRAMYLDDAEFNGGYGPRQEFYGGPEVSPDSINPPVYEVAAPPVYPVTATVNNQGVVTIEHSNTPAPSVDLTSGGRVSATGAQTKPANRKPSVFITADGRTDTSAGVSANGVIDTVKEYALPIGIGVSVLVVAYLATRK